MANTERVLELGPLAVAVPETAAVDVSRSGVLVAWSGADLLTVSVGRWSVSLTEEWMLLIRKYEDPSGPPT